MSKALERNLRQGALELFTDISADTFFKKCYAAMAPGKGGRCLHNHNDKVRRMDCWLKAGLLSLHNLLHTGLARGIRHKSNAKATRRQTTRHAAS